MIECSRCRQRQNEITFPHRDNERRLFAASLVMSVLASLSLPAWSLSEHPATDAEKPGKTTLQGWEEASPLDPQWTEDHRSDMTPQGLKWNDELSRARQAARDGKKDESLATIRQALFSAQEIHDRVCATAETLQELADIYRKFGMTKKADLISKLLLTPPSQPTEDGFLRAHNEAVWRKSLLAAGDHAMADGDSFLAELFFCAVMPPLTLKGRLIIRNERLDELQMMIVDRLVRLYVKDKNLAQAEDLVAMIRQQLAVLDQEKPPRESTQLQLAMLSADLGLIRANQHRFKESEELYANSSIILEKLLGVHCPQLATIYSDYAVVCARHGRLRKAEANYQKAMEVIGQGGVGKSTTKTIVGNYAKLLRKVGKKKEAEELEEQHLGG